MRIVKNSFKVSKNDTLSEGLAFIEAELDKLKVGKKLSMRAMLIAEEIISDFIEYAEPESTLTVSVRRAFGDTVIYIRSSGSRYDPYDGGDPDEDSGRAIRSVLLRSVGDKLRYSHKNGVNSASITVGQNDGNMLTYTVAALVIGVLAGILLKYVFPAGVSGALNDYVLIPVSTIFINAMMMIVGPLIFFSIVTSISQFNSLSEFGKIGAKVLGMYLLTSVAAVIIAFALVFTFKPGTDSEAMNIMKSTIGISETETVETSVIGTLESIVPSNIVNPFLESNTIQIIFLAVICGAAVGKLGKHSGMIKELFESLNSLFITITSFITRLLPVVVFACVCLQVENLNAESAIAIASFFGTFVLGVLAMLIFYGVLIVVMGRLNPIRFYKKNREGMITSFSLASSSAAIPTNIRICTDKMGISPKVCNFSIPLGATINMDGGCIFLVVSSMFLANLCRVDVPVSALISMSIAVVLLSLSAPGIPGAGLVVNNIVLAIIGVPVESFSLIVGIYAFVDMLMTLNNTTGDVAASLIVARSEGLVDLNVFNDNKT